MQELRDKFTDKNDIIALQHRDTSLTNKETWEHLINYKSISEKISEWIKDKKIYEVKFNDDEWKLFNETNFDQAKLFFGLQITPEDYSGLPKQVQRQEAPLDTTREASSVQSEADRHQNPMQIKLFHRLLNNPRPLKLLSIKVWISGRDDNAFSPPKSNY